MREHPIEGLMQSAMGSIADMVDVNTIIGEPIETSNNIIIIPISKVGFGFAAGGSEFNGETVDEYSKKNKDEIVSYRLPFGGGSGAGVSISPVAFLVVQQDSVKLLPVNHTSAIDKILDYIPDLMEKVNSMIDKKMDNQEKIKEEIRKKLKEEGQTFTAKVHPIRSKTSKIDLEQEEQKINKNDDKNDEIYKNN